MLLGCHDTKCIVIIITFRRPWYEMYYNLHYFWELAWPAGLARLAGPAWPGWPGWLARVRNIWVNNINSFLKSISKKKCPEVKKIA